MEESPEIQINGPPPEEESRIIKAVKRALIILISLILIFLFLSYLLPSYNFFSIVAGRLESYEINDNTIILKNNEKIIFQNNSYNDLAEIYYDNQQHEFKVCLIGEKKESDYLIKKVQVPKIIAQDFSSVTAEPCSSNAIISLHSHPYKSCFLSMHDVKGYKQVKNINPDAIIGIICEAKRFNFYGFK